MRKWFSWLGKLDFSPFWREPAASARGPLPFWARDHLRTRARSSALARRMVDDALSDPTFGVDAAGPSIEQRIIDGLDRSALIFLKILENEERDTDGNLVLDAKTRADYFRMLNDYMTKRKKAAPDGDPNAMPPYELIRKWLDEKGFRIVPKSKPGRPSAEELALRAQVMGEDAVQAPPAPPPIPTADSDMAGRLAALANAKGAPNA